MSRKFLHLAASKQSQEFTNLIQLENAEIFDIFNRGLSRNKQLSPSMKLR